MAPGTTAVDARPATTAAAVGSIEVGGDAGSIDGTRGEAGAVDTAHATAGDGTPAARNSGRTTVRIRIGRVTAAAWPRACDQGKACCSPCGQPGRVGTTPAAPIHLLGVAPSIPPSSATYPEPTTHQRRPAMATVEDLSRPARPPRRMRRSAPRSSSSPDATTPCRSSPPVRRDPGRPALLLTHYDIPDPDPEQVRLTIDGRVDRPLALDLAAPAGQTHGDPAGHAADRAAVEPRRLRERRRAAGARGGPGLLTAEPEPLRPGVEAAAAGRRSPDGYAPEP